MFANYELPNPHFTEDEAQQLTLEHYGFMPVAIKPLGSFQDQNFRVKNSAGEAFVLRIENAAAQAASLDLQNKAMAHIAAKDAAFPIQRLIPAMSGQTMPTATREGATHFLRLLTYLPGDVLANVNTRPAHLLDELGTVAGMFCVHLADFTHPAADRVLQWDLQVAQQVIDGFIKYVAPDRRPIIEHFRQRFVRHAGPLLPSLRRSIIHGDLTSYNTLVQRDASGRPTLSGIVDFGDVLRSYTVGELVVAVAECIINSVPNALPAAARTVKAFHQVFPLQENELATLFHFICLRMCVTACSSSQQLKLNPENEYVRELARLDWLTLDRLQNIEPEVAHATFRYACNLEPHPNAPRVRVWLKANAPQLHPMLVIAPNAPVLDLSANSEYLNDGVWEEAQLHQTCLEKVITAPASPLTRSPAQQNSSAPEMFSTLGRYGEVRIYAAKTDSPDEPAALHLGVDVFAPSGSAVYAPLAGEVVKVLDDEILVRYTPIEGVTFFTRVARVQAAEGIAAGASVAAGQTLAHTVPAGSESFLPTHAHIQLACAQIDTLPGLVPASDRAVWESLCPDANLLLNYSGLQPATHIAPEAMMHRRFQVFQRAQEFYFEHEPLQIVRGWKQYLYATDGRAYLDAINNVAHVGHSHPRVAEAAAKQLKRLYTNSRFLYDGLAEYAERLVATLPEPLRVVFFVCSGSEANDLALRLARTYTEQKDVIVIDGEYLGNTSAVYEISTSLLDNPLAGKQARPFVHMVPQPNLYRGKYRREDPHAAEKYAGEVREIVANLQAEGRGVAAFFTEALLGSSGGIDLPHGFLPKTYEYVRAAGGVCISDEVQVGFGRAGTHFWMFQTQDVVPDIVTMGKPMGNGFPVSAVVTTPAIAEAFRQKTTYFSTFAGNAAACQVGLTVLDIIEQEGLQENARVVGAYFKASLQGLMEKHALIGAVYGFGLYMGVELVRDRETKQPATEEAAYVAERMRHLGIIVYPTGDYYNILKLKPPLVFTKANADYFVAMLDKVLSERE